MPILQLQIKLPKVLIENLEIVRDAQIIIENNKITIKLIDNILDDLCEETRELHQTHKIVGCHLSSAIACVLAKTTGKIVMIQKEQQNSKKETTIHYKLLED